MTIIALRVPYPPTWSQRDRDLLDEMFAEARRRGLWFRHQGLAGIFWFTPDELEAEQKNGRFLWGACNWTLKERREYLAAIEGDIAEAQARLAELLRRATELRG